MAYSFLSWLWAGLHTEMTFSFTLFPAPLVEFWRYLLWYLFLISFLGFFLFASQAFSVTFHTFCIFLIIIFHFLSFFSLQKKTKEENNFYSLYYIYYFLSWYFIFQLQTVASSSIPDLHFYLHRNVIIFLQWKKIQVWFD